MSVVVDLMSGGEGSDVSLEKKYGGQRRGSKRGVMVFWCLLSAGS